MNRQDLFDLTVKRLSLIAGNDFDAYTALEASALVRKLILDDDPLLHQINRQRRRRVRFEVASNPAHEREVLASRPTFWMPGLSPQLTPPSSIVSLTLDQFLAYRAMHVQGQDISVKTVIKQLANVEGGTHAGTPRTEMEKLLHQVNGELGIGGMGSVAHTMRGIADVVAAALGRLISPS